MINYKIPKFNIEIGSHPEDKIFNADIHLENYDVILNVSDNPVYGLNIDTPKIYWFPINEFGSWSYSAFYWFTNLMDFYIKENKKIYIHCLAGAHRSPIITYIYFRSIYNEQETLDLFDFKSLIGEKKNWFEEVLINDINAGRIPEDVVEFIKDIRNNKELSMMSLMKKRGKLDLPDPSKIKVSERKPVTEKQLKEEKW
jgi:hypothetical protein